MRGAGHRRAARAGITFVPAYYLGEDDFWTADRAVSVNIPWYLANPHAVAAGERSPVRVLARRGADVPPPRGRPRDQLRVRAVAPARLDPDLRRLPPPVPRRLQPQPVEPRLRPLPASRRYVPLRAEAPRRRLGRDVRRVAGPRRPLAAPLPRLAGGAGQARVRRPHRSSWRAPAAASPSNVRLGTARAVHRHAGDRRRVLRHRRRRRQGPASSTARTCRTSSCAARRARARHRDARAAPHTANAQSAARFIQQHQQILVDRLSAGSATPTSASILRFLRQLQALCTHEHLVVPDSRRTEKLVELTVVATWHVVDGIHRLS